MTCAECIARSGDWVDGTIPSQDRARFSRHLAECEACARYARILNRGLALVREIEPVEPSPEFRGRLHRRLHGLSEERRTHERSILVGAGTTVVLAAAIAGAAWLPVFERAPVRAGMASATVAAEPVRAEPQRDPAGWRLPDALSPWVRPTLSPPPSMTTTLPGPYSPLVVQPPSVGRSAGRVLLTAYLVE